MCRLVTTRPSTIRRSTGCSTASRSPSSTTASCTSRAARCWEAPARSTAWSICAATPPTTTSGASAAAKAGTTTPFSPTSSAPRTMNVAPTRSMAPAARSRSRTIAGSQHSPRRCTTLPSKPASRPTPISTARYRKASATTRPPSTRRGAGRVRGLICAMRRSAETSPSRPRPTPRACSSKTAAPSASIAASGPSSSPT